MLASVALYLYSDAMSAARAVAPGHPDGTPTALELMSREA